MLLENTFFQGHRGVGRPGMEMWRILVLKQGLGCDFDRLHNLANHHETVRAIWATARDAELQTIVDNVSLMRPELGGGATGGGERPRGREKKAWRAVARAV